MSRRIFLTLLSILFILPLLVLAPKALAQVATYSVSGYVCDDLNFDGKCQPNEPGIPGMTIYADNSAIGQKGYSDAYGHFIINNLPAGAHSIEIAGAGGQGRKPTGSEKYLVSGATSQIGFGIQQGYSVAGFVTDESGRPVSGKTVYVDLPNRQSDTTDARGYYQIDHVGYDSSNPIPGVSGGHNVYVEGYTSNPYPPINPQNTTPAVSKNISVTSQDGGVSPLPAGCYYQTTYAINPSTSPVQCSAFQSPCSVPVGWQIVGSCAPYNQPPVVIPQCSAGLISFPVKTCDNYRQCTTYTYQRSNCDQYQETKDCQYISGACGYPLGQGSPGSPTSQCTVGQAIGASYVGCNYNTRQYCTNITTRYSDSSCMNTYQDYQGCQSLSNQCGYQTYSTYSAGDTGYLQGQQNFQDFAPVIVPAPQADYVQAPATWVDNSWTDSYYQQTWYDQSTPYIAPDSGWSNNPNQDWYY